MKKWTGIILSIVFCLSAAAQVQDPESFFGFRPGSDYKLAGWEEIVTYFHLLDDAFEEVQVRELGKSTQENDFIMVVISSAENMQRLDEIRSISRRLSDARMSEAQAERLAEEGKIVVLITCSLHATEVGAAQASPELVHHLVTADTPENRSILENVVFLLVPSFNPDGLIMVKEWYDAHLETAFEGSSMPWLYHLYVGHDNNRDACMLTQAESRLVNRVLYHDWLPQVYLDMHQMGNSGARIFVPPFIDPLNPNTDPLIVWENALFGNRMAMDLNARGKEGVGTSHAFTSWWEGAFLMNAWWHNTVGLLTELASCRIATPVFQTMEDLRGGRRGMAEYAKLVNFPDPWPGGWWRLRDIVEYDLIAARSVLKLAAQDRETLLYNRFLMGKNALKAGAENPPYAYVIPTGQRDRASASRLVQVLLEGGVEVHRARSDFRADEVPYDQGAYVVLMEQSFRSWAKDILEPQAYPDIREFEGGPPIQPYDVAGWTLPLQMGVEAVKVTRHFEVELERVTERPADAIRLPRNPAYGYGFSHSENDGFILTNRLMAEGFDVYWSSESIIEEGRSLPAGTVIVPVRQSNLDGAIESASSGLDLELFGLRRAPHISAYHLRPVRLGIYQPWTASMHEGWSRWLLETYEFPFRNIRNEELRAGNLQARFDVIYIPDIWAEGILKGREKGSVPPEFAEGIGHEGLSHLKDFVESGGTLICMDSSSDLLTGTFGLPVTNVLNDVSRRDFYCPGSILAAEYNTEHPVAYGMTEKSIAFFARSPAFKIIPNFKIEADAVAVYPSRHLLKSGFLLGEGKLAEKIAVVDVSLGGGHVVLIGFDAINRAQAHATYKILFNAILYGTAETVRLGR